MMYGCMFAHAIAHVCRSEGTFPEFIFYFHSGFCGSKSGYTPFMEKYFYQLPSIFGYIVYFKNIDF